jgi:hypothetical protein
MVAIGNWCLEGEGFGVKVPQVFSNVKETCLFEHPIIEEVLKTRSTSNASSPKKVSKKLA